MYMYSVSTTLHCTVPRLFMKGVRLRLKYDALKPSNEIRRRGGFWHISVATDLLHGATVGTVIVGTVVLGVGVLELDWFSGNGIDTIHTVQYLQGSTTKPMLQPSHLQS